MSGALDAGATVITSTRRLSRLLNRRYAAIKQKAGHVQWASPRIMPWRGWLASLWKDLVYGSEESPPLLLDAWQEQVLWVSAIEGSPEARHLLQVEGTAAVARQGWNLAQGCRIPITPGNFEGSEDTAAFLQWSRDYQARCRRLEAVEMARLPALLETAFRSGALQPPRQVWLAGFDEWSRQQEALLKAVEKAGCHVVESQFLDMAGGGGRLQRCGTAEEELHAAAAWAREILLRNPVASIGVVIPELEKLRTRVEDILSAVLHAHRDHEPAFHLSGGPRLESVGMIHAALAILETLGGELDSETVTTILLSPYVGGAEEEGAARARLDVKLRERGGRHFPVRVLREEACPRLTQAVEGIGPAPEVQAPSGWSRWFAARLELFGWPAMEEADTAEAWKEALEQLSRLDLVVPIVDGYRALAHLRRICRETRLEAQELGQPVQILTVEEAAGADFDHVWIAGMHDDAWPPPARPNPFLPVQLQAAHGVPGATARSQLERSERMTRALLASGAEVVVSYPAGDEERAFLPSPLIAHLPARAAAAAWRPWHLVPAALEQLVDETAPRPDAAASGGAAILRLQSACPFRAFAELRLQARPMESPDEGLDPRLRGQLLHKVMEHFWERVETQERLLAATEAEVREWIGESVDTAFEEVRLPGGRFHARLSAMERERLRRLVAVWLQQELARAPFQVVASEEKRVVELAGLRLKTRADRVDELADGRRILIDYKSTAPSPAAWEGERPKEPQLPLYAIAEQAPLAGLAFVDFRRKETRFRGIAASEEVLPGAQAERDFEGRRREWRRVLEGLAGAYLEGRAEVDPQSGKDCKWCHLHSLCRIHD
ncbi:MAG: hypothetical protein FJW20_25860 [Acidimicrobiia bacterium]|nr:hypothetical protein [Acidimicrobiia bacterium]